MNITKQLFKKLYRDYRIAYKSHKDDVINSYFNSLGNHRSHYEILCNVQECYHKHDYKGYKPETGDYIFYLFTK
jgi:hypothetical protein